jgi:hypothetical protein
MDRQDGIAGEQESRRRPKRLGWFVRGLKATPNLLISLSLVIVVDPGATALAPNLLSITVSGIVPGLRRGQDARLERQGEIAGDCRFKPRLQGVGAADATRGV